jgi:hypothetical protein
MALEKPSRFIRLMSLRILSEFKDGMIVLNNLDNGNHILNIYNHGLNILRSSDFQFHVSKPWYFFFF